MNIVVTGGYGFIGSHLTVRLLNQGHVVTVVDDLSTGSRSNLPETHERLYFRLADVQSDIWMGECATHFKPDRVYNLACPASPVAYQRTPIATTLTSVLGTYHALELAYQTGARILQASTSEVYGDPSVHPQPESYWGSVNSFGPRSCYDEGKRCAESLCYDFSTLKTDVRIARIFNTYGENMAFDDGRVVSNFIVQALQGKPLTIYGDGNQSRSFCYVDDTVDGLIMLMESGYTKPVNIGNPTEFTMAELAKAVLTLTKSKSIIEYRPLPIDDPRQRQPDITLAKSLGWEPKVQLRTGLEKTIEYFRRIV